MTSLLEKRTAVIQQLWALVRPAVVQPSKECRSEYFLSGSFRLGLVEESSDVDMVVAATADCGTREDVMERMCEVLKSHSSVTDLNFIRAARIPLVSCKFSNVEFDIAVAMILKNKENSMELSKIRGIDDANEGALGGPRHTEYILKHVKAPQVLGEALRRVRQWAKARELYGSKFGFLGGVSWSLMTAFIAHFETSAESIVRMFFRMFSKWAWDSKPVTLSKLRQNDIPSQFSMAVMTPVAPVINSSQTVNRFTREVIVEELTRAAMMMENNKSWEEIVAPVTREEFLKRYKFTLSVSYENVVENEVVAAKWLKLSYMMDQAPYHLKSVIWPHVNYSDKEAEIYMCLEAQEEFHTDKAPIAIQPVLDRWRQVSFSPELQLTIKFVKSKTKKRKLE